MWLVVPVLDSVALEHNILRTLKSAFTTQTIQQKGEIFKFFTY